MEGPSDGRAVLPALPMGLTHLTIGVHQNGRDVHEDHPRLLGQVMFRRRPAPWHRFTVAQQQDHSTLKCLTSCNPKPNPKTR